MYPMQGTTGQDEPNAYRPQAEDTRFSFDILAWAVRFWIAAWLIGVAYSLWEHEPTRLEVLNAITRALHSLAKYIGMCALLTEKAYYDTVDSLH